MPGNMQSRVCGRRTAEGLGSDWYELHYNSFFVRGHTVLAALDIDGWNPDLLIKLGPRRFLYQTRECPSLQSLLVRLYGEKSELRSFREARKKLRF